MGECLSKLAVLPLLPRPRRSSRLGFPWRSQCRSRPCYSATSSYRCVPNLTSSAALSMTRQSGA